MNKTIDTNKLNKLQKLNTLLPHEIRGQSQVLPRIVSAVQRGEFGLTKTSIPESLVFLSICFTLKSLIQRRIGKPQRFYL